MAAPVTVMHRPARTPAAADKLEDQAASAALYVTKDSTPKKRSSPLLDEDGKLSSASAAISLKHARAQDLPSFPSTGGVKLSSAGAAASLADNNKKSVELWKPGAIPAANKAALLAKDFEPEPLWTPNLSQAGSKAALLAHTNPPVVEAKKAPEIDPKMVLERPTQRKKPTPNTSETDVAAESHRRALMAAAGAMSGSRRRADSAPIKPQTENSAWALKAATTSQRKSPLIPPSEFTTGDPGFEAARIQNVAKNNVSRQMYGSTPPVSIEVEEKKRQDVLRASAVAMAQKMYAIQQAHIDQAKTARSMESAQAAGRARQRAMSDVSNMGATEAAVPPRYENLEEAARRLAQERLAKLSDEHAEWRTYYGQTSAPQRSKLSIRHRRRNSSFDQDDDSDEEQSRKIRSQMSIFQTKVAEVDTKKRQADRDALLQAAHRNVTAQMNAMDEKLYQESGKTRPQQREIWERQAKERAQRDSDERMINVGKVHVGGGKYLEQSEIDAIAKARLQPTLDDITDKAEKQRARDEEIRLEQARVKAEAEKEKQRQAEIKAELKAAHEKEKQEERVKKAEEKRVQREEAAVEKEKRQQAAAAEKEKQRVEKEKRQAEANAEREKKSAEAAAERERQRLEKEEKRRSKDNKGGRFSNILNKSTVENTAIAAAAVGGADATPAIIDQETVEPAAEEMDTKRDIVDPDLEEATKTEQSPVTTTKLTVSGETEEEDEEAKVDTETKDDKDGKESIAKPIETKSTPEKIVSDTQARQEISTSPSSPSKGDSRVKSWFKTRFRTSSKSQSDWDDKQQTVEQKATSPPPTYSLDVDIPRTDSMRDVALAGHTPPVEKEDLHESSKIEPVIPSLIVNEDDAGPSGLHRSPSISSASSDYSKSVPITPDELAKTLASEKIEAEQARSAEQHSRLDIRGRVLRRQNLDKGKDPIYTTDLQPKLDSKDDEDEARDTFDEDKYTPQPKLPLFGIPRRTSKGKFKENL